MSKHVWRMHYGYNCMRGVEAYEPTRFEESNATLVSDDACLFEAWCNQFTLDKPKSSISP